MGVLSCYTYVRRSKPKSFIITKDVISKHVFGAGYPSLPTMTVEEFYEQQYKNIKPAEHNQRYLCRQQY